MSQSTGSARPTEELPHTALAVRIHTSDRAELALEACADSEPANQPCCGVYTHKRIEHGKAIQRCRSRTVPDQEVHTQVMLGGTYVNGWRILVTYTGTHVTDWLRTDQTTSASLAARPSRRTPTEYAVIDELGYLPFDTQTANLFF